MPCTKNWFPNGLSFHLKPQSIKRLVGDIILKHLQEWQGVKLWMFNWGHGLKRKVFAMPRPKKQNKEELITPPEHEQTAKVYNMIAGKSRSYQKSQKRLVKKLIPIQPVTIQVKEVDGKRFEWVPCEEIEYYVWPLPVKSYKNKKTP